MTVQAELVLYRLAPGEKNNIDKIDRALTLMVEAEAKREYHYDYSRWGKKFSTSVLQGVKKLWQDAGWSVSYDGWYIYLTIDEDRYEVTYD